MSPTSPKLPWRYGIRHRPQSPPRRPRLVFETSPLLADRPVAEAGEHPGQSLPNQLLIDHGVTDCHEGHRPSVAVRRHRLDLNHLGEDEDRGDMFSLGAEVLMRWLGVRTRTKLNCGIRVLPLAVRSKNAYTSCVGTESYVEAASTLAHIQRLS